LLQELEDRHNEEIKENEVCVYGKSVMWCVHLCMFVQLCFCVDKRIVKRCDKYWDISPKNEPSAKKKRKAEQVHENTAQKK